MSTQLMFFAVDVIGFFSVLLFGLRVLVISPKQPNAQLIALICFNSACAIVLARQDYAFWIPEAYQLHVGMLRIPLHLARNLTSGLLMILCHSLFQDETKLPRWLIGAFALQVLMECAGALRTTNASEWQYDIFQAVPALLQLLFVGCALFWMIRGWRADLLGICPTHFRYKRDASNRRHRRCRLQRYWLHRRLISGHPRRSFAHRKCPESGLIRVN